jgi:dienelactone hydrolase
MRAFSREALLALALLLLATPLSPLSLLACSSNGDTQNGGSSSSSGSASSSGTSGASSGASSGTSGASSGTSGASGSSGTSGASSGTSGASSGTSGTSGAPDGGTLGKLVPGDTTLTINAAGQARTVILHVPAAVSAGAIPLVLALHGNGDTSANFVATSGIKALSDSLGFVLAAPQGITQTVTVGGQTVPNIDWDAYRSVAQGNIDVPLLQALQGELAATGSIDLKHVVVYGYSQGGYMSFRYGMDAAASLACSAVLAAADPMPGAGLVAGAARKIPVAIQIGDQDYGISGARQTKTELDGNGNPNSYVEIAGAGHVPIPGDPAAPLTWCRGQALP